MYARSLTSYLMTLIRNSSSTLTIHCKLSPPSYNKNTVTILTWRKWSMQLQSRGTMKWMYRGCLNIWARTFERSINSSISFHKYSRKYSLMSLLMMKKNILYHFNNLFKPRIKYLKCNRYCLNSVERGLFRVCMDNSHSIKIVVTTMGNLSSTMI